MPVLKHAGTILGQNVKKLEGEPFILACFIQNPKLSVLITCLVEGAIQGVTNSGNVKSALGLAKSRLGYNM